jgi:hypothetical protein
MSRTASTEADLERAVQEAEILAADLEAAAREGAGDASADCALFARALRSMARTIRLGIVAQIDDVTLLRFHVRLETTMRRAAAQLVEMGVAPTSQRPTTPPPPGRTPSEVWSGQDVPSGERQTMRPPPPATTSEIRAKVLGPPSERKKKAGS